MSFSSLNLNPHINKAIHICGYTKPTPIQARCIPTILSKKDVMVSAQTGSGKTAAFILPVLHHLSTGRPSAKARALILTPTRELARQIHSATSKYGQFLKLNVTDLVGGTSYQKQLKSLSNVDIIIATPGRLLDHIKNHSLDLSTVEILILDEADRMLDMGFLDDVKKITNRTPQHRQTLLFSATLDNKAIASFKHFLKDPTWINLSQQQLVPSHIKQELYIVNDLQHKYGLLHMLLTDHNIYKAIIFTATKSGADKLANLLNKQGHVALPLHSDLKQKIRNRTIEQLRCGKAHYVVATDIAARGIDIHDITHVVNFDLPRFSEDYIHRIGRTGRAGEQGHAVSFALRSEGRYIKKIETYIDQQLLRKTPTGTLDNIPNFTVPKMKRKKKRKNK